MQGGGLHGRLPRRADHPVHESPNRWPGADLSRTKPDGIDGPPDLWLEAEPPGTAEPKRNCCVYRQRSE